MTVENINSRTMEGFVVVAQRLNTRGTLKCNEHLNKRGHTNLTFSDLLYRHFLRPFRHY